MQTAEQFMDDNLDTFGVKISIPISVHSFRLPNFANTQLLHIELDILGMDPGTVLRVLCSHLCYGSAQYLLYALDRWRSVRIIDLFSLCSCEYMSTLWQSYIAFIMERVLTSVSNWCQLLPFSTQQHALALELNGLALPTCIDQLKPQTLYHRMCFHATTIPNDVLSQI